MKSNRILSALAVLMLAALPVSAQQGQMHRRGGSGMMEKGTMEQGMMGQQGMGMMAQMSTMPSALLSNASELGLSEDQKAELTVLDEGFRAERAEHMKAMGAAHETASKLIEGENPDWAAYEKAITEAAGHMAGMHVAMVRASRAGKATLEPEQMAKLESGMSMTHSMMSGGMGMQGSGGMQRGMDMQSGMGMQMCQMMMGGAHGTAEGGPSEHDHSNR